MRDRPLEPRDEAVFLLTDAAEIEHVLMVQYLHAAHSIHPTDPHTDTLTRLHDTLTQIAREEMGHLMTAQNLVHFVGGPLHLSRDRAPYGSETYPFRFTLEPVTPASLAKYVTAESPSKKPDHISDDDWELVQQLADDAKEADGGNEVQHVGPVFERLAVLIGGPPTASRTTTSGPTPPGVQGTYDDWGLTPFEQSSTGPAAPHSVPQAITRTLPTRSASHPATGPITSVSSVSPPSSAPACSAACFASRPSRSPTKYRKNRLTT